MTDHLESIARGFCEHMLKGRKPHSDGTPAHERSWQHGSKAWIGHTEAFIAALSAAGLVIVPRDALAQVTQALKGPGYLIRELQAISSIQGDGCPLRQLERAMIAVGGDDA